MLANPRLVRLIGPLFAVVFTFAALAGLCACPSANGGADVLAKVNGAKVMRADVDRFYNARTAGAPQKPTGEEESMLRLQILRGLIDDEIYRQRAEKLGLTVTDDDVQNKLNVLKAGRTAEEFDKELKARGETMNDLKDDIRRSLLGEKVFNKEVISRIEIKDSDIKAYYDAHKADFNLIEPHYRIAEIIVTIQPGPVRNRKDSKAQNDADARRKIQMILNRIQSGEDFNSVALDWSEDESAVNGGDLGLVPQSGLKETDPGTRDAVLKLKPDQISGIIPVINPLTKQLIGYRIVKVLEKEPEGQRELNDPAVQQFIRNKLRDNRGQLLRAAYEEKLRDEAKVENYYADSILKKSGTS